MLKFLTAKMKCAKAQSSAEFFMLVGLAFISVIFFVAASANEAKEFRAEKEFFLVKDMALKLQKEINIAAYVENGYERKFNLPSKLEGILDYSIVLGNSTITVNSSKVEFSVAIPHITGNFTKGSNRIEKISNQVYVNQ